MSDTPVRLAGAVNDSIVDGPGIRLAIFVQGCSHHCKGCQNPETWNPEGGYVKTVDDIARAMAANPLLDGITLSGGEPMEQPVPLTELADIAHEHKLNVWCYSGYTFEQLLDDKPSAEAHELLRHVDVLVDGPYVESERSLDLHFRGSANQRIIDVPASLEAGEVVLREA